MLMSYSSRANWLSAGISVFGQSPRAKTVDHVKRTGAFLDHVAMNAVRYRGNEQAIEIWPTERNARHQFTGMSIVRSSVPSGRKAATLPP